ncbi:Parvalbumin [Parasponia andersonii]|uniref:Parvalbumin n=1 Tax=Parasponia andersonii TaxID=3476 RepID=A0A2P5CWE2_PARAD|nr:Parvalbumin [Parasponia andersonii]
MEKTTTTSSSPEESTYTSLVWALAHLFFMLFSNWEVLSYKLIARFKSLFQSNYVFDNSKVRFEKGSNTELGHRQEVSVTTKDDENLRREDLERVMGSLELFCSRESEELKDSFGSDELSRLFEEEEPSLEEVKQAFDVFDQNRDGFIDDKELQRVLCVLGLKEGSELEDCKKMINTFDENRDGKIDFREFVKFMENIFC